MWKRVLVAAASALVAGVTVSGTQLQAGGATLDGRVEAQVRVASAQAAAAADERSGLVGRQAAADEAARALAEQRAAEAERAAAEQAAARAAAEQAAAERAAAEQAAAEQAAAERASRQARAGARTTAPAPAAAALASDSGTAPVAWRTTVANSGGQAAIDECLGGLTRWFERVDGKPYYPIHRGCGGEPILDLRLGEQVQIDGATWVVTDARDVPRGSTYAAAAGLAGQILLQTCYRDESVMRLVALTAA